jgi:hypothetical protein
VVPKQQLAYKGKGDVVVVLCGWNPESTTTGPSPRQNL